MSNQPDTTMQITAYHGTGHQVDSFDRPCYFSTDEETAARYADEGMSIYRVTINYRRMADHEDVRRIADTADIDTDDLFDALYRDDLRTALSAEGYDAVTADEGGEVNILTLGATVAVLDRADALDQDAAYDLYMDGGSVFGA